MGTKRMERYVRDFRYGNADASGPIDQFWLGSSLQISAFEQVDFLKQLVAQQLPVSERRIDQVQHGLKPGILGESRQSSCHIGSAVWLSPTTAR